MYGRVFIDEWWQWFGRLREKWVNSNRNFSILLDLIPWKKMKKEMELSTHGFTLDLASQVAMVELRKSQSQENTRIIKSRQSSHEKT